MSKRNQKGRRHRTVNRTPRPVTRRRTQPPGHLSTQAPAQAVSPDATTEPNPTPEPKPTPQRAAVSAAGSAAPAAVGRVTAPAAPEVPAPHRAEASSAAPAGAAGPAPAEPAGAADGAEPDLSRVFGPAREGGLGRSAAQTWRQLKERGAEGATLQELSEAVGFQQATVSKHMTGLADHSLALRRDDRWYAASTAP